MLGRDKECEGGGKPNSPVEPEGGVERHAEEEECEGGGKPNSPVEPEGGVERHAEDMVMAVPEGEEGGEGKSAL